MIERDRLLVEVGAPDGVIYAPQWQKWTHTAEELLSAGIVVYQGLTYHAGIGGASASVYVAADPRDPSRFAVAILATASTACRPNPTPTTG